VYISAHPGALSRIISRNCNLRHDIEGKRGNGRKCRQLMDELEEEKGTGILKTEHSIMNSEYYVFH
jgi:hypothetical protein